MSGWRVLACLLAAAAQLPLRAIGDPGGPGASSTVRLGFSSSVFVGVNENDARAAMKVWGQTIASEHNVALAAEPILLKDSEEIAGALRNKLVDALTISVAEYSELGRKSFSTNAVVGVNAGVASEEYLLLVRRDGKFDRIEDLRGRSLIFFATARTALAPIWFETLLLQSGLGQARQFCGPVSQGIKLTQAVLPVFFRKTDACVVTRRGFQTMTELNPEVGRQLKTLAASPALVPVIFLFRADYRDPARDLILANIEGVHSTVASQQVLTLFQCENVLVRPISVLDPALDLLAVHARLSAADNQATLAPANVPLANRIAGGP